MTGGAALALLLAGSAAASPFLDDLHRAAARDAADPERVEFAARAIREWTPADGAGLLAEARLRRAEGEAAAFDDAAAAEDLTKALELDPRNDRLLLLRGRARLRSGAAAAAERDFAEYSGVRPDDPEGWLGLGRARVARGLPAAGAPARDAAARAGRLLDPGDPRPRLIAGGSRLAARDWLKALDAFEAAAAAGGETLPEALAGRARAKAALGDAKGARADAGRAAESFESVLEDRRRARAPEAAVAAARVPAGEARFVRAGAEERLGLSDEAREDYRLACALGHAPSCARETALAPAPPPPPAPKPRKRRRIRNPKDDPGTRIYAN